MATIIKKEDRDYQPHPGRTDGWRLMTDMSRKNKGLNPQYLNFDMRELPPHQYNAAYHFHRYAEELFMMCNGVCNLTHPGRSDGDYRRRHRLLRSRRYRSASAVQSYRGEPCTYLDIRTSIGYDVVEYPDSGKLIITPTAETFKKDQQVAYFDGEEKVDEIWKAMK